MMKFQHTCLIGLVLIIVSITLIGCSTLQVPIQVMRPAEINLNGKRNIIMGNFNGKYGPQISSIVREKIDNSGYFTLIDRRHLGTVLKEAQFNLFDLTNPTNAQKVGQLATGSIFLTGNLEKFEYKEKVKSKSRTCSKMRGKKMIKYKCTHYTRTGTFKSAVAFDLIDLVKGTTLKSKRYKCERSDSNLKKLAHSILLVLNLECRYLMKLEDLHTMMP